MRWLNYHHLHYFWTIARLGSVTAAGKELRLAQPTLSAQLRAFEEAIGEKLFEREGRSLRLSEAGSMVFRYAEEIFNLGNELRDVMSGKHHAGVRTIKVGISDVLPKTIAHRLIDPVFDQHPTPKVICIEDSQEKLLIGLATHELDLVLADGPIPPSVKVKAYNHFIGQCGVSFVGQAKLLKQWKKKFPALLAEVPMLLPAMSAAVRRELDQWFDKQQLSPQVVMEFQDSALMKTFGREGRGIFPVPTIVEREVCREYNVQLVGRVSAVQEKFYLISLERKLSSPSIAYLCKVAQASFRK